MTNEEQQEIAYRYAQNLGLDELQSQQYVTIWMKPTPDFWTYVYRYSAYITPVGSGDGLAEVLADYLRGTEIPRGTLNDYMALE